MVLQVSEKNEQALDEPLSLRSGTSRRAYASAFSITASQQLDSLYISLSTVTHHPLHSLISVSTRSPPRFHLSLFHMTSACPLHSLAPTIYLESTWPFPKLISTFSLYHLSFPLSTLHTLGRCDAQTSDTTCPTIVTPATLHTFLFSFHQDAGQVGRCRREDGMTSAVPSDVITTAANLPSNSCFSFL